MSAVLLLAGIASMGCAAIDYADHTPMGWPELLAMAYVCGASAGVPL